MTAFSDFDTDYYGMNRFHDIMQNGGNVDLQRLKDFISESVGQLADNGREEVKHIDFGNGFSVVVAWEPAVGAPDDGKFVDGGYEICVSVRETGSAPRVEEWNNISGSVALTVDDEANGYADVAEELYVQIVDADPETVDSGEQIREETVFDSLPDFKGTFEKWQNNINNDFDGIENKEPILHVEDLELGKYESSNGIVGDCVYFVLRENLVDADIMEIDEYLTNLMPQEIVEWLDENNFDFNFGLEGRNKVAFLVW